MDTSMSQHLSFPHALDDSDILCYSSISLFHISPLQVFNEDVCVLVSMDRLWRTRTPPTPLTITSIASLPYPTTPLSMLSSS